MTLSPDDLQELVATLGQHPMPHHERRQGLRTLCSRRAAMVTDSRAASGELTTMVVIRNISAGGVGILHAAPLQAGQQFFLRFDADQGQERTLHCKVIQSNRVASGLFATGACFCDQPLIKSVSPTTQTNTRQPAAH